MKLTISISDNYVQTLYKWASVQRTLMRAQQILEDPRDYDVEDRMTCASELREIGPAIDHLHRVAREQIWNAENRGDSIQGGDEVR